MRDLIIEKQKKEFYTFPEIYFDAATGICEIEGESFMENAKEFYQPLFDWLNEFHQKESRQKLEMNINLSYYNTSSSKSLYQLIFQLKGFSDGGQPIEINWKYNSIDREMEDDIMDLQIETGISINMISK
jgi:hypothetical protein